MPIITKLCLDSAPKEKTEKIIEIYVILKKYFSGSEYLAYTASVLADMVKTDETDALAARGNAIYKLMRKEHPFLTSSEDSPFAILLAFSDKSDEELIFDMETCYTSLKPVFSDGNSVQSLSHVLALAGGNVDEYIERTVRLYDALKSAGRKYSRYYELPVLGALAVVSDDIAAVTEDVLQADSFLAKQKGYGFWGLDKKTRLMHAVMLVSNDLSKDSSNASAAAVTGTLTMIAAQQAATCAVIASSVAASSASSN